jgi:hypothetical protein
LWYRTERTWRTDLGVLARVDRRSAVGVRRSARSGMECGQRSAFALAGYGAKEEEQEKENEDGRGMTANCNAKDRLDRIEVWLPR